MKPKQKYRSYDESWKEIIIGWAIGLGLLFAIQISLLIYDIRVLNKEQKVLVVAPSPKFPAPSEKDIMLEQFEQLNLNDKRVSEDLNNGDFSSITATNNWRRQTSSK